MAENDILLAVQIAFKKMTFREISSNIFFPKQSPCCFAESIDLIVDRWQLLSVEEFFLREMVESMFLGICQNRDMFLERDVVVELFCNRLYGNIKEKKSIVDGLPQNLV